MMQNIIGLSINKLNFKLEKRGDIYSFDGPFLSHFSDNKENEYLMLWVENDEELNRWMLFKVDGLTLFNYFLGNQSLRDILLLNPEVYFLDIDEQIAHKKITVAVTNNIPSEYIPEENTKFDELYANSYAKELKKTMTDNFNSVERYASEKVKSILNLVESDPNPHIKKLKMLSVYNSLVTKLLSEKLNERMHNESTSH